MNEKKYRRGGHILSLDELAKQDFVYFRHKIYHEGWFGSWQLRFIKRNIGENGHIYYAEKVLPDKIECTKCKRRFAGMNELKRFLEIEVSYDDYATIDYDKELAKDENAIEFRGCPHCRTDQHLIDLEAYKENG